MGSIILHHYDGSPFSEKMRLMLGFKGMAWRSVKVPVILPKPDVVALTGGYRRTPIAQFGADIYCDTALITRLLERLQPTPTLFPDSAPLAPVLAEWADSTLFWTVIPYAMQPAGAAHVFQGVAPEVIKAFAADRAPFAAGVKRQGGIDAAASLDAYAEILQAQLADGRLFLFGAEPSVADFSVAHCAWYVRRAGPLSAVLDRHALLAAWMDRMLEWGHGSPDRMGSEEAIAEAAAAAASGSFADVEVLHGLAFEAGTAVTVTPIDYGTDPSAGTLVGLTRDEVVIERIDARAGRLHVHFPRRGYQIRKDQA